jgi:hypothetical protein
VALKVSDIQRREDHWAIIDLVGKAGHVRTVPVPAWVKAAIDVWTQRAPVISGKLFRVTGGLGVVITVLEGMLHLNQYQQNWINYRSTCEACGRTT